jgi:hypothetical protein
MTWMRASVSGIGAVAICSASRADDGLRRIPEGVDMLRVDDQSSPEAVLMALNRAGLGHRRFDAVHTTDEWSLVTAALLARYLGASGPDPSVIVNFRDKSLQKSAVRRAGLPAAQTLVIEDVHDVSGIERLPFEPAVLKPIAGAAAAHTTFIASLEELDARSSSYRELGLRDRTFVLEEYQHGEEWYADGVVQDGEMLFCAIGHYGDTCLNSLTQGLPMWSRHFDPETEVDAYDRALPLVTASLEALGLCQRHVWARRPRTLGLRTSIEGSAGLTWRDAGGLCGHPFEPKRAPRQATAGLRVGNGS